jgi:hypothetical protein
MWTAADAPSPSPSPSPCPAGGASSHPWSRTNAGGVTTKALARARQPRVSRARPAGRRRGGGPGWGFTRARRRGPAPPVAGPRGRRGGLPAARTPRAPRPCRAAPSAPAAASARCGWEGSHRVYRMARAARGRRALARCGRAREYPSCRGGRRGCSVRRRAGGVRGASQQRNRNRRSAGRIAAAKPHQPGATPKPRPSPSPTVPARGGAGGAGGRRREGVGRWGQVACLLRVRLVRKEVRDVSGQYGWRDETCPASTGGRGEGGVPPRTHRPAPRGRGARRPAGAPPARRARARRPQLPRAPQESRRPRKPARRAP